MNQILQTNLNKNNKKSYYYFKVQFYISVMIIIFLSFYIMFYNFKLSQIENFSDKILNNYNITKLYSNSYNSTDSKIIGIIEIPSININYPIFSICNNDLLKISPCKLYGPLPGKVGNLCIAAHNYDNYKFFSKINVLKKGDNIILYDNFNTAFSYIVSNIYEVSNNDLSPLYNYDTSKKQLTLITCNNLNNNRIIVKSFCK